MNIMITKEKCKFCDIAKQKLSEADVEFKTFDVNDDCIGFMIDVFEIDTVPFAVLDGIPFRNSHEIQDYIDNWRHWNES